MQIAGHFIKICQHIGIISVSGCPLTWCYFKQSAVYGRGGGCRVGVGYELHVCACKHVHVGV